MTSIKRTFTKVGTPTFSLTSKTGNKIELVLDVDSALHLFINGRYKNTIMSSTSTLSEFSTQLQGYVDESEANMLATEAFVLSAEGFAEDAETAKTWAETAQGITEGFRNETEAFRNAAAAIVSGGPRMPPYANLAALNAANPDHQFTYLTSDNGHWNAWNGTAFESGGVYQTVADYALKSDLYKDTTEEPIFIYPGYGICHNAESTWSQGDLVGYGSDYNATDFISLENVQSINMRNGIRGINIAAIAFYDIDKNYISSENTNWDDSLHVYNSANIPISAKYVRFSNDIFYVETEQTTSIIIARHISLDYRVEANENAISENLGPIASESWAVCGDSITHANHAGIEDIDNSDPYCPFACTDGLPINGTTDIYKRKNYAYYIAKKNRLRWANYGWGGTTLINCFSQGVDRHGFSVDRYQQLEDGIDFKFISLFFGENDSNFGIWQQREIWLYSNYGPSNYFWPVDESQIGTGNYATLEQYNACLAVTGDVNGVHYNNSEDYFRALFIGTIDSTDNKTWYGAWNTVLPYLMLKYPLAKILLIVPFNRRNVGPTSAQQDAVKIVAAKWGLPYYDFRESCPFLVNNTTPITGYEDVFEFRQHYLTADGLHPSQDGYEYIYPSIGAKLMSI